MKKYDYLNTSLPLKKRIKNLVSLLTTEEKIHLIPTHQAGIPRLGIKDFGIGGEIARGYVSHNDDEPATVFPQPIGMASMFDTELMEKIGEAAGTELRYYDQNSKWNHLVLFGPTVDLCRDPRWGRTEECYGEDPFLAGQMVKHYTKGIVGNDPDYYRAVPSLKHFYANNNEANRTSSSSNIEPRTKYEYYYRAFKPAIEAGYAPGIMTSYNSVNGLPAMLNPEINEICKKKWGMKYALTDGGDFTQTVTHHNFTKNHAQTISMAIKNGTDIMCDNEETVVESLRYALKKGLLTEHELDKAVINALYPRFLLGEFNPPENDPYRNILKSKVNCSEFKSLNLQAAKETITLLKNNGLLPLKKENIKKLALIGIHAKENFRDWYTGTTSYNVTVYDGLKTLLPNAEIYYEDAMDIVAVKSVYNNKYLSVKDDGTVKADCDIIDESCKFIKCDRGDEIVLLSVKNKKYISENGIYSASDTSLFQWFVRSILKPSATGKYTTYKSWNNKSVFVDQNSCLSVDEGSRTEDNRLFIEEILDNGIERAKNLAAKCDHAIVCVGNDPMMVAREEYDRKSIELPQFETNLIKNVFAVNKNTVTCIISSYPYSITKLDRLLPAIIYTAHGGAEMGNAVAQTIIGLNNPAGRTSLTWYKSTDELPDMLDYDIIKTRSTYLYYDRKPLYPFGYGLSYSEFKYDNLNVTDKKNTVKVSVDVENISETGGDEVVQIYLSELNSRYKRPLKQLCGFKRRFIKAGEKVNFIFNIDKKEFGRWDVVNNEYVFDEGKYVIYAGGFSSDNKCRVETSLSGKPHSYRDLSVKTPAISYDDKKNVEIQYTSDSKREYVKGKGTSGGSITFYDCDFKGGNVIIFKASTTGNASDISFFINGEKEEISSYKLPSFVEPENFATFETHIVKPVNGIHDLTIKINENINLYSIKIKNDSKA